MSQSGREFYYYISRGTSDKKLWRLDAAKRSAKKGQAISPISSSAPPTYTRILVVVHSSTSPEVTRRRMNVQGRSRKDLTLRKMQRPLLSHIWRPTQIKGGCKCHFSLLSLSLSSSACILSPALEAWRGERQFPSRPRAKEKQNKDWDFLPTEVLEGLRNLLRLGDHHFISNFGLKHPQKLGRSLTFSHYKYKLPYSIWEWCGHILYGTWVESKSPLTRLYWL